MTRTVRVRIEGEIDCADDLSDDDLLQMMRRHPPHEFKAETILIELVHLQPPPSDQSKD